MLPCYEHKIYGYISEEDVENLKRLYPNGYPIEETPDGSDSVVKFGEDSE